jgi:excisionase family DNA binding protein
MPRKTLNIKQVQEVLNLSERTVFRLIKSGELKGFKAGREWRFEESDLDLYIERQRAKAQGERPVVSASKQRVA